MKMPITDIETLKPATDNKTIADKAIALSEEGQVAAAINYASLVGQSACIYNHSLSTELQGKLVAQGYTIEEPKYLAKSGDQYIIKW